MSTIENWRRIRHANIVSVREAFTTKAFGDHCKHKIQEIREPRRRPNLVFSF